MYMCRLPAWMGAKQMLPVKKQYMYMCKLPGLMRNTMNFVDLETIYVYV